MIKFVTMAVILTLNFGVFAHENFSTKEQNDIRGLLKNIFEDNGKHANLLKNEELKAIADQQNPRATVVACSDSRVQSTKIDDTPINDLFFIRNIGNQISTAKGSVEYGIRHLHTPVLLIIGHVQCGAIKAALGDYSKESENIKRELDNINLSGKNISVTRAIVDNVNDQVLYSLKEFAPEIKASKLLVIGTVYDFRNEYGEGYNRLIVVNVNGETNPDLIRKNIYLKNIDNVAVGIKNVK